jgi:signal transduction histidine kinase
MPGTRDDDGAPDHSFIALSRDGQARTPRELSRLIAAVSHEIISPVSNIAGFSRLLATDPQADLDEKTRDLVLRIRRNAVRLAHLVDEAATIARLTWELEEPAHEPVDLREIVTGALKDTAEVTAAVEPGPDVRLPEGGLQAAGDARRLRVAVGGLLLNLAKDLNTRRITVVLDRPYGRWRLVAWHASPDKDDAVFAPVEGEGGGPSAVIVMELFRALGCEGRVSVSPEGARKIEILLPQ